MTRSFLPLLARLATLDYGEYFDGSSGKALTGR
jgi:hypothetical protein